MNNFKQWDGFKGRIWKEEVNTRDFIQHNYAPYEETRTSWKDPQKLRKNSGLHFQNCRKRSVQKAAFWIWIRKLYPH